MENEMTGSSQKIIVDSIMKKVKLIKEKLNEPTIEKGVEIKLYSFGFISLIIIDKAFNTVMELFKPGVQKAEEKGGE